MKKIQFLIAVAIFLFAASNVSAQFGGQGMGGGMNNQGGYGQGGRISNLASNSIPQDTKPAEESDKSKKERLDVEVNKLKTDLKLDELQIIVVRNVLADNQKKQIALFKKEIAESEKITEYIALTENTDRKIKEFLNAEQKLKYVELTADRKEKMQELADKQR